MRILKYKYANNNSKASIVNIISIIIDIHLRINLHVTAVIVTKSYKASELSVLYVYGGIKSPNYYHHFLLPYFTKLSNIGEMQRYHTIRVFRCVRFLPFDTKLLIY